MDKEAKYKALVPKIQSLLEGEDDITARMANVAALLHPEMGFWWTGFYRVQGGELVLGPFQGPVACTRIAFGRGVCGTAWRERRTVIVPDVELFPGHIACSSESRSEIVVPLWRGGEVAGVLDIDSREKGTFDETDRLYLEQVAALVYASRPLRLDPDAAPAERVQTMEQAFRRTRDALDGLRDRLAAFRENGETVRELARYQESGLWQRDYELDEAGGLPKSLPRGVLSQDALFDLLNETGELRARVEK